MRKPFLQNRGVLFGAILTVVMIVFLAVYITSQNVIERKFDGNRTGNSDSYHLSFELMNMTDDHVLKMADGEVLHCTWTIDKGSVDILVADSKGEKVYRGDNVTGDADFELIIQQGGDYTVTVTGYQAKGRIDFTKVSDES